LFCFSSSMVSGPEAFFIRYISLNWMSNQLFDNNRFETDSVVRKNGHKFEAKMRFAAR